jgi:hypothetical protein
MARHLTPTKNLILSVVLNVVCMLKASDTFSFEGTLFTNIKRSFKCIRTLVQASLSGSHGAICSTWNFPHFNISMVKKLRHPHIFNHKIIRK